MERVLTDAVVENLYDLHEARQGNRSSNEIRRIVIPDALVDTKATTLGLPTRMIAHLGLSKQDKTRATSARGPCRVYDPVQVTIMDRVCTVDVVEFPDDRPPLIGQVPLTMLDLVVDLQGRRLIGNPIHGGEHTLEI